MYGWQTSYSVGVPAFDHAHQQLFDYFNDFYAALKDGKSQNQVAEILEKTYAYTKQHFESEEKWLAAKNDPELFLHKTQHRQFQLQIQGFLDDYRAGRMVLSGTISKVLREWLSGHIMTVDQKYAARYSKDTKQ